MHVDIGVDLLRDVEDDFDVPAAVGGRGFVERHAADHVNAKLHDVPHQHFGARRLDDSLLWKCDDLDVDEIAKAFPGEDQTLCRTSSSNRIDVNMGAQPQDAVFDRPHQYA